MVVPPSRAIAEKPSSIGSRKGGGGCVAPAPRRAGSGGSGERPSSTSACSGIRMESRADSLCASGCKSSTMKTISRPA